MRENKCRIVSEMIRRDIASGTYQEGDKVPSEHQLAYRTGYSRTTIRRAVLELEREGLVQRRQGSGTYICGSRAESNGIRRIGIMVSSLCGKCGQSLVQGMESVIEADGDEMICEQSGGMRQIEARILTCFLDASVDGVLAEGIDATLPAENLALYDALQAKGIPVVFVNSCYREIKKPICVAMDDQKAGHCLGKRLIQAGHRHIAVLMRWDQPQGLQCFAGLTKAFSEAGIPLREDHLVWYTPKNRAVLLSNGLDRLLRDCTAAVCYDEETAEQVMRRSAGVSCVSFVQNEDDGGEMDGVLVLNRPSFDLGRMAAEKLLNILRGRTESTILLEWDIPALQNK